MEVKGNAEQWGEFLRNLLTAILRAPTIQIAKGKMDQLGTHGIESCQRAGRPLLYFAGDLDKACNFAGWQAKIFNPDEERFEEILVSFERKAFTTLESNFKMVEGLSMVTSQGLSELFYPG